MSVVISDSSNPSYNGNFSRTNGFYRVEASNLGLNGATISLAVEQDIAVTFANAGSCKGIVIALVARSGFITDLKSVKVTLQENVASVWTDRATQTLTAAQISALTDLTAIATNDMYIVPFDGGTFPYTVTTAANTWRFAVVSTGSGTNDWGIQCSNVTAHFYATWCDNAVSYTDNTDQVVVKDLLVIDQSVTLAGALGTGQTSRPLAVVICRSSDTSSANVAKLTWQNPPASSYTMTTRGLIVISSHGGFRIGTAASPIPFAQRAVITMNNAAAGVVATDSGLAQYSSLIISKHNLFMFGQPPTSRSATLAADAAVGAGSITTVETTGWVNGDIIYIGGQDTQGSPDMTYYTVSSSSGQTVNLTGTISTVARKAGGHAIRYAGYAIYISAVSASFLSACSLFCTNAQLRGVQVDNMGLTLCNSTNGFRDDPSAYDPLGCFVDQCAGRGPGVNPSNFVQRMYMSAYYASYFNSNHVAGLPAMTGVFYPMPGYNNTFTIDGNIILSSRSSATSATTLTGAAGVNCIVSNNALENQGFIGISQGQMLNNRITGVGSTGAVLLSNTGQPTRSFNNTYENNVCALSTQSAINHVEYHPTLASNQVCCVLPVASTVVTGKVVVVSPVGTVASPAFLTTNFTQSGARFCVIDENGTVGNNTIFTNYGTIVNTGPGLADTTARTSGGYALRFEPNAFTDGLDWPQSGLYDTRVIPTGNINGRPVTVSAWVNIRTASYYAGTHSNPTLSLGYDGTAVATSVAADQAGTWQQLAVTVTPTTNTPYVEAWINGRTDATGTNAHFYVDDLFLQLPAGVYVDLGKLDYWENQGPAWPPLRTNPTTTAIQTFYAQASPAATTEQTLYTVPATALSCVVSSIAIANRSTSAGTFRFSYSPNSAATQAKDYLYYDVPIAGTQTFTTVLGLTPQPTGAFRVYSSSGSVGFTVCGSLIT